MSGDVASHLQERNTALVRLIAPFVRAWVADDPAAQHRALPGTIAVVAAPDATPAPFLNDTLEAACARGGQIIQFSGDRIVIWFTGPEDARRAEETADDLALRFGASVGLAGGEVEFFLIGFSHRELFVSGEVVGRALEHERLAGRIASSGPRRTATPPKTAPSAWTGAVEAATFVPEALRRRVWFGSQEPERNEMAVGLIHLANLDELRKDVGAQTATRHLADLVARVQRSFAEHDIAFLRSEIGIGGPAIVCAAGFARTGRDDDERILRAFHEITDYPSPIELRAAVDRGTVTSGSIGSEDRATLIAMGDVITSARRLLSYAGASEILATPAVVGRAAMEIGNDRITRIGSELVYRITKPKQHHRGMVNMLLNLGTLAFEHDDHTGARHYFEEALTLSRHLGHQSDEALLLMHLGRVALAMGDAELAMVRCDESLVLRRDLDDDLGTAETLALLGRARCADGDTASARLCWLRAMEILRATTAPAAAPPSA